MAEGSISVDQDQFNCPVCLDLLKDPVTINCGHSYCMSCITDCWNQDDQTGVYSCPQCRQTFTPRPALGKNTMLAEVVEKLKKTKLKTDRPAPSYAGSGDVECDICTGRKHKAVKSCLVCLESYCQTHFERHEEFHTGRRHKVTDATGGLQEMMCSQHERLLEVFCRTDHKGICLLCTMNEHKTHDTVPAAEERAEKQKLVLDIQRKFQQRMQNREKELKELKEAVKTCKCSAQAAVEDSEKIFTELIRSIERSRSEFIRLIRDQKKTAVSEAEGLLRDLQQEIDDLKKRDADLEQLSHTEDHIHFLQSFQCLCVDPESTDSFTISSVSSDDVRKSVSELKEQMEDFFKEEIKKISDKVTYIEIIPREPKTRAELLQYSSLLSLDPNTVNKNISLSEGNKVATRSDTVQQYPDHPDRFCPLPQVLCRESVCGRCYWEVEWRGNGVGISVSYESISRKGEREKCVFGCNDQSWRLFCSRFGYIFSHNNIKTKLPVVSRSSRIGVYVDHRAGTLSFYRVSDTMTLIHRVQTAFTQPLYAGFWIGEGSTVKLQDLIINRQTDNNII